MKEERERERLPNFLIFVASEIIRGVTSTLFLYKITIRIADWILRTIPLELQILVTVSVQCSLLIDLGSLSYVLHWHFPVFPHTYNNRRGISNFITVWLMQNGRLLMMWYHQITTWLSSYEQYVYKPWSWKSIIAFWGQANGIIHSLISKKIVNIVEKSTWNMSP